jgi:4-hydroxybenzoate polyprenyltransferase
LPLFAWVGAGRELPVAFIVLLPAAVAAGAALAIANALVDVERDTAAGARSIAVQLGRQASWRLAATLQGAVAVVAIASVVALVAAGGRDPWPGGLVAAGGLLAGLVGVGLGLILTTADVASRRERGWELQAAGTAMVAAGWVGLLAAARLL